jgi:chromate transporter
MALSAGLSAITAAVVGVVLNLGVWFSLHTLFASVAEVHVMGMRLLVPDWSTLNVGSAVIAVGAFAAIFRFKLGMLRTLAGSVLAGAILYLFFGST